MKIKCVFRDIPLNTVFYTHRMPNKPIDADSIQLYRENDGSVWSNEWSDISINPLQPCWYFID